MQDNPLVIHKSSPVFDKGTLIDDVPTFYINNAIYQGFKNIRLKRSMQELCGSFDIVLTDKWKVDQEDFKIKPGDRIHCHLGKHPLFEGYVDDFNLSFNSTSRNLSISGRDRVADIIDCSVSGPSEYNNIDLAEIAIELIKPFGLKLIKIADVGSKFDKVTIKPGESVFEVLDRLAKQRKVLLTSSTHGNLVLDKKSSSRSSSSLKEGVNILNGSASFNNSQRYSSYTVKGQSSGLLGDAEDSTSSKASSTDNGITRFRPLIIVSETSVDNNGAQDRANFESSFRAANAAKVNITVQGWTQEDGTLWSTNKLIKVSAGSIGIYGEMLISGVKFELGQNGTLTELELIRPDAFEFKIDHKKEDDPLDNLGWDEKK